MTPDKLKKLALIYPELAEKLRVAKTDEQIKEITDRINALQLEKGDVGERGEKGDKGDKGDLGTLGAQGIQGERGEKGDAGRDGRHGVDGENGKDGRDGANGSPDSPIQIADKLNTLEGVIEPTVIKGYENSDAVIKKIKEQKLEMRDIKNMPLNMNDLRWHGSGIPSLTAGTNITLTPTSDGGYLISATGVATTPGGVNTNVQFNDSGAFGGDTTFTFNKVTKVVGAQQIIATGLISTQTGITLEETGAGTNVIAIQAPSSLAAGYTLTLPVDDGTTSQFLQTDGSGVLSWATAVVPSDLTAYIKLDGSNTGTPNTGDIMWFTGGAWTRFPRPATALTYKLNNNSSGNLVWNIESISTVPTWAQVLGAGNVSSAHNAQMTTTDQMQFRDTSTYIFSSATHTMDIMGDRTINLTASTGYNFLSLTSNGLLKTTGGTGTLAIATAGTDYEVPLTFSTGLTRTTNTITANISTGITGGQTAIGGTGATDALTFKSTTGTGTTTVAGFNFTGGTNGGTTLMTILNNSKVLINTSTSLSASLFQIQGAGANGIYINTAGSTPASGPQMQFARAFGSIASPSAVGTGNSLLNINPLGYDGSAYRSGGNILALVDGNVTSGNVPMEWIIQTVPLSGGTTSVDRFILRASGRIITGMTRTQLLSGDSGEDFIINGSSNTSNVLAVLGYQDSSIPTVFSGDIARFGVWDPDNGGEQIYSRINATGAFIGAVIPRVFTMPDGTTCTPNLDVELSKQINTQVLGVLTVNNPNGTFTPSDGQLIEIVIKSTNVQTFSWGAIYRGCTTVVLPVATTGGGKTDKFYFQYNATDTKWDIAQANFGY